MDDLSVVVRVHKRKVYYFTKNNEQNPRCICIDEDPTVTMGDWFTLSNGIMKISDHPITVLDSDKSIYIESFLIRRTNSPNGVAYSPLIGNVSLPEGAHLQLLVPYFARFKCYYVLRKDDSIVEMIKRYGTMWAVMDKNIRRVQNYDEIVQCEKMCANCGMNESIENKPTSFHDIFPKVEEHNKIKNEMNSMKLCEQSKEKDELIQWNAKSSSDHQSISSTNRNNMEENSLKTNGTWNNKDDLSINETRGRMNKMSIHEFQNGSNGSSISDVKGLDLIKKNHMNRNERIQQLVQQYPYLGVVVRVEKDIIVIHTREVRLVYAEKVSLDLHAKLEMTSCNWVRIQIDQGKRNGFIYKATKCHPLKHNEVDEEWRSIEWAVVNGTCPSIKINNATLTYREVDTSMNRESRSLRGGERLVYHPFIGGVIVDDRSYDRIGQHRDNFDATVQLDYSPSPRECYIWRVTTFVYDKAELTINGYMSKIGFGKWQQVRDANLPRLAIAKQRNNMERMGNPSPNAAIRGSLGWHIPPLETSPEEESDYVDVLLVRTSTIADKIEFNRELTSNTRFNTGNTNGIMNWGTGATKRSEVSMEPAVTTMPKTGERFGSQSMNRWNEEMNRKKNEDDYWFNKEIDEKNNDNKVEFEPDDKDRISRIKSIGLIVDKKDGSFIVWLKTIRNDRPVIVSLRSHDLYISCWIDANIEINEESGFAKVINFNRRNSPDEVVARYDPNNFGIIVSCRAHLSNDHLSSSTIGLISITNKDILNRMYTDEFINKDVVVEVQFVNNVDEKGNGLQMCWDVIEFNGLFH